MKDVKRITVLMPVYNGEKYLSEAIESILKQTYKNFNFLIINDGSTDASENIVKSYHDSRINYIVNERNMGIIKTLNKGLKLAQTEYIVRMDADDISLPTRLEKQIEFMDKHKDIAVSGSFTYIFDENGKQKNGFFHTGNKKIKTLLLFTNPIAHPAVIIRKEVLDRENYFYDEDHQAVEDYGLWEKISHSYKITNIPEVLLKYRINLEGITQSADKNITNRDVMHMKVYKQAFDNLGIEVAKDNLILYRSFVTGKAFKDKSNIPDISEFLRIVKKHIENPEYDLKTFNIFMNMYFITNCVNERLTYKEIVDIYKNYFSDVFCFNFKQKIKFIIQRYF